MIPHKGAKKEICFLVTTLTIFSASYVIRVIYDFIPKNADLDAQFREYMIAQLSGLLFDLVPICLIVVFHRHNLAKMERLTTEDHLSCSHESHSILTDSTEQFDDAQNAIA